MLGSRVRAPEGVQGENRKVLAFLFAIVYVNPPLVPDLSALLLSSLLRGLATRNQIQMSYPINFLPKTTKLSIFVVPSDIQPPDGHIISESVSLILIEKSGKFHCVKDNATLIIAYSLISFRYMLSGVEYCLFDTRYSRTSR